MVRHDYQCASCHEIREYEHPMNEDPDRCLNCGSDLGLIKKISVPFIKTSNKSGSSKSKYLEIAQAHNVITGDVVEIGVTREVRRDGCPLIDVNGVNLNTGEKIYITDALKTRSNDSIS